MGVRVVVQVAQKSCGVSLLDTQKLSEHGHGQVALGVTAWAGRLDQMVFRHPLPPQPFCSSVIVSIKEHLAA